MHIQMIHISDALNTLWRICWSIYYTCSCSDIEVLILIYLCGQTHFVIKFDDWDLTWSVEFLFLEISNYMSIFPALIRVTSLNMCISKKNNCGRDHCMMPLYVRIHSSFSLSCVYIDTFIKDLCIECQMANETTPLSKIYEMIYIYEYMLLI